MRAEKVNLFPKHYGMGESPHALPKKEFLIGNKIQNIKKKKGTRKHVLLRNSHIGKKKRNINTENSVSLPEFLEKKPN